MSRLDYITIAIVIACILAIIFLVYKMTDLFTDKPAVNPVEIEGGTVEQEDSTTYNYNIDEETGTNGEAATDSKAATSAGQDKNPGTTTTTTTPAADEEEERTPVANPEKTTPPKRPSSSSGKFMVIAGTFSQSVHAKAQLQHLKKLGFTNATIENFDRGKYDVILVDRFDNMAAAERLVKDLKAEGVSSYVKAKEGQ